jgi:hypothetical protein
LLTCPKIKKKEKEGKGQNKTRTGNHDILFTDNKLTVNVDKTHLIFAGTTLTYHKYN